ncbi:MAG: biopolymer transporter ExbD [Planctomycetota bacterium]
MASKSVKKMMDEQSAQMDLTPVIDMSFLLIVFFILLPFKTLEGKLAAYLPTDKGINTIPQDPLNEIKVSVHIVARKEEPRPWGLGQTRLMVSMPTEARYRFGDQDTDKIEDVGRWIRDGLDAAKASGGETKILGEIKAGHKVPVKFVVAVLNKFAEAGLDKVDFYGTALPPPELRRSPILPYPKENYSGVSK